METLSGKRVLLVEDDLSIALIVKSLLFGRPYHYQVEQAESLASGLNKLAANDTDLVILDLNLPDSSGLETFHRLRADAPQVAIVILTSEENEENAFRALQDGAQDYLYKWELKERSLVRSVTYAIERKQAELALRESRDRLEEQVNQRTSELQLALQQSRAAEQQLQRLSRQLVEVQEAERRHVARELHDELGQTLTGLKLTLEALEQQAREDTRPRFAQAQQIVQELGRQIRALSHALHPALLDDLGLLPTLISHCQQYTARTNVQVAFHHSHLEGRRFAPELETAAYRIVQEALTNVARHAQTPIATVHVVVSEEFLSVQITDQGCGFDPRQRDTTKRGVRGMQERVALLGGKLHLDAAPGAGVSITASLPLELAARYAADRTSGQP